MQGTIDMRSNPVVRKRVMAIVRNATASPAGAPAARQHGIRRAGTSRAASRKHLSPSGCVELEALRSTARSATRITAKRQQIIAEL